MDGLGFSVVVLPISELRKKKIPTRSQTKNTKLGDLTPHCTLRYKWEYIFAASINIAEGLRIFYDSWIAEWGDFERGTSKWKRRTHAQLINGKTNRKKKLQVNYYYTLCGNNSIQRTDTSSLALDIRGRPKANVCSLHDYRREQRNYNLDCRHCRC